MDGGHPHKLGCVLSHGRAATRAEGSTAEGAVAPAPSHGAKLVAPTAPGAGANGRPWDAAALCFFAGGGWEGARLAALDVGTVPVGRGGERDGGGGGGDGGLTVGIVLIIYEMGTMTGSGRCRRESKECVVSRVRS